MVSSYIRMRCPLADAIARYRNWIALPEIAAPQLVRERNRIDLALTDGNWRGLAVFVFTSGEWTVFEEISGAAVRSAERWLELADGGDLVYAAYNDAIPNAELVRIERGRIVRHIVDDEQDSGNNADVGELPEESGKRFTDWIDVMGWIEDDELKLSRPEEGLLWIHEIE